MLAVAPRVTAHREELAAELRVYHGIFRSKLDPFAIVVDGATRRDLARQLGDEPTAQRWQRIIDAQAKLFADRERLEALLLSRRR